MSKVYEYYNDERMSLEGIEALVERIRWLESTLNKIAEAGEQANPIHLSEMAKCALDGNHMTKEYSDCKELFESKLSFEEEKKESEKRIKALHRAIFESQG